MAVFLSPVGGAAAQFFDNSGLPLTGGKLYTYQAGTTTPQASYTTSAGNVAHSNPIILDASGRVPSGGEIWITANVSYKFVLKTSTDTLMATMMLLTLALSEVPIISNQVASDASAEYQNCVVNTKSATSAIVWLNTAAANINPFWQKDAIEIIPGRYAVPTDAGTAVMRASTDQGIELVMQKWYDINTMKIKYRLDTLFGVVNKQPEMSGVILFSQS